MGIREEILESPGQQTAGILGNMKGIEIWGPFGSVGEQVGRFSKRVVSRHSMKSSKNPIMQRLMLHRRASLGSIVEVDGQAVLLDRSRVDGFSISVDSRYCPDSL